MIKQSYGEGLQTYIKPNENDSVLKEDLRPWTRGVWDEYDAKTRRIGLLGDP